MKTVDLDAQLDSEEAKELIRIRRHLHAHPELSLQERATQAFLRAELEAAGVDSIRAVADTGLVAEVVGAMDGPTIAVRGDIDALPIQEEGEAPYRSQNRGVMHACGHDAHATLAVGVARRAVRERARLHGRVRLLLQPAEEASPEGEPIGAERMALEGALEGPPVDAALAMHCMPTLEVGRIGYTGGAVWARSDLIEITIKGKKTHAAYPHSGIDAVVCAAHLVVALQTVASRRVDARDPIVVSIGRIEAGTSYNIIADRAELTGIVRSLSDETSELALAEIDRIARGVALLFGAECEVRVTPGARLTANDVELERFVVAAMGEAIGSDRLVAHLPQMGAEDFSAIARRVPSCYLFLGVRNEERGITHMIHTPRFDIDERSLPLGVEALWAGIEALGARLP